MIKVTLAGQTYTIAAGIVTAPDVDLQWIADDWQAEYEFLKTSTTNFSGFDDHDHVLALRLAARFPGMKIDLSGHAASFPPSDGITVY